MQEFYGTKKLAAKPMTRLEYNTFRGWDMPDNENGSDEGYLVEYLDGGKPNVEGFTGYISWSPKEQFENAYTPTNAMSFGHAITAMKSGYEVARSGWNGKNMFIGIVGFISTTSDDRYSQYEHLPCIAMKTADNKLVPWLASQTDMLANDWQIV